MSVAILIDGGFFIKKIRRFLLPEFYYDAQKIADFIELYANTHAANENLNLYRIFFYDCPPLNKKMHHPITHKAIDFSKSKEAVFRTQLHLALIGRRKVALRLGHLAGYQTWIIKPRVQAELFKGTRKFEDLNEDDVTIDTTQKGVDMRIGVDIASISLKKQVKQIVLLAGDADFVPAAKMARREGLDFMVDPIKEHIHDNLKQHIDGILFTCYELLINT